jgi:hypothetical protein
MKNKSLLIASVFAASSVFAQDLTSKKGEPILPEAGDWAITFDATPFINYFGNMFNGTTGNTLTGDWANGTAGYPWAIRGKMFKDEKTAYRAGIRLGFGSNTWTNMVDDASDNASTSTPAPGTFPDVAVEVEDQLKKSSSAITLAGGLEMRKGKTRLQGYYGGELFIATSGSKKAYTYGNALSTSTTNPVGATASTDWSTITGDMNMTTFPSTTGGPAARITEWKSSSFSFGLRGFIGAEYFVMSKISVGVEYGWGFGMTSSKTSTTMEAMGADFNGDNVTASTTVETKTKGMSLDTDIIGQGSNASLNINFHF